MPRQDFNGNWTVSHTSGTPFGIGAEIDITETGASLDGKDLVIVYDKANDVVLISGIDGMQTLVLAVFKDRASEGEMVGYRAIYGGGLSNAQSDDGAPRLVTCAAQTDPTGLTLDEFRTDTEVPTKTFTITTTSGTQFGVASNVSLQAGEDQGTGNLTITNALDQPALDLEIRQINGTDATFKGTDPETVVGETPRLSVQISLVQLPEDGASRIFGIEVVGDPENSGVWGGDEDDPPDSNEYHKHSS